MIADGIAAATGNCGNLGNNSCSAPVCLNPNHWANYPNLDPSDPRLTRIFLTPYNATRGLGGADSTPVGRILGFYITAWGGTGPNQDPCTGNLPNPGDPADDHAAPGTVVGHYVDLTQLG